MTEKPSIAFPREAGEDIGAQLAHAAATDIYTFISEFPSNSYNWGASQVNIIYTPEDGGCLSFSDDGYGMDVNGMRSFTRLAGSIINQEPIDPITGRVRLGGRGTAVKASGYLAENLVVRTSTNGSNEYLVFEGTDAAPVIGEEIIVNKEAKDDPSERGTTVILRNLKFSKEANRFSLEKLVSKLSFLPITGTVDTAPKFPFDIYLNGEMVEPFKVLRFDTQWAFDEIDDKLGRIHGKMYLSKSKTGNEGLYLRVFGRTLGDPQGLLADLDLPQKMKRNLTCVINADGLDKAIQFGRNSFDSTHPSYVGLTKVLGPLFTQGKEYFNSQKRKKSRHSVSLSRRKYAAAKAWNVAGGEFPPVTVGSIDGVNDDIPGIIGDDGTVVVNENHPGALGRIASINKQVYQRNIRMLSLLALMLDGEDPDLLSAGDLLERVSDFLTEGIREVIDDTNISIFPNLLYQVVEVASHLGLGKFSAPYLIEKGVLSFHESEKMIIGQQIIDLAPQISVYAPLPELVKVANGRGQKITSLTNMFAYLMERKQPYFHYFAGSEAIGIHRLVISDVEEILEDPVVRNTSTGRSYTENKFITLGVTRLSPLEASQRTGTDVGSISSQAERSGFTAERGKYEIRDLIRIDYL